MKTRKISRIEKEPWSRIYLIAVDYNMTLADMIAAGKYDFVYDEIRRFPVWGNGRGRREMAAQLIPFGYEEEWDKDISALERRGLSPATIVELLAFGAKYPDIQREFSIKAMELPRMNPCTGGARFAELDGSMSSRALCGSGYGGNYFLAVSEPPIIEGPWSL